MADNLIVEKRNMVAMVTLNRPEVRNAFDGVLIADLTKVFLEIEKDETVRVMVLAGAGLNWKAHRRYTRLARRPGRKK